MIIDHSVTPEEADKMKCPMSFGASTKDTSHFICLGPECMAWRWNDKAIVRYRGDGTVVPNEPARGYCGMVRT